MKTNNQLIEKLKKGNEDAFNLIYYDYYKLIYYIINTLVHDKQVAEDLMQEAFIKMVKNINLLNDNEKFHYWFIKLTKNICYNYLKKVNKNLDVNSENLENYPDYSYSVNPPKFEFNSLLNDFENYVITLHIVYKLTFNEIACDTGKTMSVVTKAYYNALKILKNYFEEERNE